MLQLSRSSRWSSADVPRDAMSSAVRGDMLPEGSSAIVPWVPIVASVESLSSSLGSPGGSCRDGHPR